MKTKHLVARSLWLLALAIRNLQSTTAHAQGTRFFHIAGPAAAKITAFRADGTPVWSNALAGTNYTVQAATSLIGGTYPYS